MDNYHQTRIDSNIYYSTIVCICDELNDMCKHRLFAWNMDLIFNELSAQLLYCT